MCAISSYRLGHHYNSHRLVRMHHVDQHYSIPYTIVSRDLPERSPGSVLLIVIAVSLRVTLLVVMAFLLRVSVVILIVRVGLTVLLVIVRLLRPCHLERFTLLTALSMVSTFENFKVAENQLGRKDRARLELTYSKIMSEGRFILCGYVGGLVSEM